MPALWAVCAILTAASATTASTPSSWTGLTSPLFSHVGQPDGLPYPVALALAQDRQGFIWIGTPGGLARWDGYRMRVFRHRSGDPHSLPENIVAKLLVDEDGRLWVGTVSGLVTRYLPERDGFVTYRDAEGGGRMQGLASDGEGGLWAVGTNGLAHLDPATGRWRHDGTLRSESVNAVRRGRDGTLWLATGRGLMRRRQGSGDVEPVALSGRPSPQAVTALAEDRGGTLWFGTATGEIGTADPTTGQAELLPQVGPSGQRVNAIVEVASGTLWIGDFGRGIRELDREAGTVRAIRHDPEEATSLSDDSITDMLVDRSGLVWTSGIGGVDMHNPESLGIMTILPSGPAGLPGKDVRSMGSRSDGKVWLGFRNGEIALLDPVAGRLAEFRRPSGPPSGPPSGQMVQAIAETADGEVWTGTRLGLRRFDPVTGTASSFPPLQGANVLSLLAEDTVLWAGGGRGLVRIDIGTGTARVFAHAPDRSDSLSDNSVQSLLRDRSGRLWVGTQRGLNRFDAGTGTFERFLNDPEDPESLPNDIANTLMEDRQGRLWVGTANGIGILTRDPDGKPRFRTIGTAQGLPHDTVTMLLQDGDGTVWAAGGDRLAMIDENTLAVRTLGLTEGAGIRTHWTGSGVRLPDGTLLFGGFGGMTAVRPGARPEWDYHPPVVATEVKVGGKPVPVPPSGVPVVVTPDDRDLAVELAALDFSEPDRNRYAYRLEGFDHDWVAADAQHRTATYTGLPPGSYRLLIRGSNRSGVWSEHSAALAVEVLPAWYQTTWFYAAALLAAGSALVAAVQGRTTLLRRRERELERLVALRTAEVEAAHARALAEEARARHAQEEAEAADQAKSRFLAVISHEIRTPLNGVLGMLQMLDPTGLAPDQHRFVQVAKESGGNLISLIESILEYGRYEAESEVMRSDVVDPHRLAEGAVELFRPQVAGKDIVILLEVGPGLPAMIRCDSVRILRVLHNLLGNAVKFTPRGRITVSLNARPGPEAARTELQLVVSDSGIGIAPEMHDAIFRDFVQADDSIARRFGGTGLGLAVCRRIATLLGGSLTLDSALGIGSSFRFVVPVEAVEPVSGTGPIVERPGLSILFVDDDPVNRQVGLGLLGRLGHRVQAAADGLSAIDAALADSFDVIMMDLHMPDLDGVEAIGAVRRRKGASPEGMRFIIMTADTTEPTRRRCTEAGVETVLTKPLHLDVLRDTLEMAAPRRPSTTSRPETDPRGLLDLAFLREQREVLGMAELVRLGRLFNRASRTMIGDLHGAVAIGDRQTVQATAHRLNGACRAMGLTGLAAAAAAIEKDATSPGGVTEARANSLNELRRASIVALLATARAWTSPASSQDGQEKTSVFRPNL